MITIRFPNGQTVQYNTANHISRRTEFSDLYERKGGKWVAHIPNTCIMEMMSACRVYNPLQENIENEFKVLTKEVRKLTRKIYKEK